MRTRRMLASVYVLAVIMLTGPAPLAAGGQESKANTAEPSASWLAAVTTEAGKESSAPAPAAAAWKKPIPLTFSINYTLVSDYIFRGINLSEYPGEGREKLNHQLAVGVAYDAGAVGTFGAIFWFEWYAAQEVFNAPGDHHHLQEVDYTAYGSKEFPDVFTTVEIGWVAYTLPRAAGDARYTHEPYVKLSFKDGPLFGKEGPVLSPYVYYGIDVDDGRQGSWLEVGIKHEFALADLGCKNTPVLKHLSLTPSLVVGVDHRYLDKYAGVPGASPATRLANLVYGLSLDYDLSGALGIPEQYGSLTLSGFLTFSQALRRGLLNDEFWGGLSVGYEW